MSNFEKKVVPYLTYLGLRPGEKLYEELLVKTEELDKTPNIYRLDHAVTANQKVILKAFGLDANSIKYFASELSKELKEAELRKENKDGKNKKNK